MPATTPSCLRSRASVKLTLLPSSIRDITFDQPSPQKTNVDSLKGEKAVVIQTIDNLKGTGQVVIRGMEWSAKAREDKIIKEGTVVKVITVEGVKAVVEEEK